MRLFVLTSLTMIAFASNSVLTRMAIEPGYIDPVSFALIRVLAGALFLWVLVRRGGSKIPWRGRSRLVGASSLAVYMIGFSLAYVTLDAGLGALILFGVVQIAMFSYSTIVGSRPSLRQIIGAFIAFIGLIVALRPEGSSTNALTGAGFMILAGLGWAAYTLSGKNAKNPLSETAANFAICLPILLLVTGVFAKEASFQGVALATICGAITSGLGYALWYSVLPDLQRSIAAVVQLSVPIIAILAGALLLGEPLTRTVLIASALVVFGIAMAVTKQSSRADRS